MLRLCEASDLLTGEPSRNPTLRRASVSASELDQQQLCERPLDALTKLCQGLGGVKQE